MARKPAQLQPERERERLSKPTVVDRGLELADSGGLESLTIRKLAQSLGVTPMALYWHFRSKDGLLAALAERVWGEMDLARDADAPWIEQFRRIFRSLIRVLRAHPAAPDLLMHDTKRSEAALRATEIALEVLRDAGFGPVHASAIARQALWTGIILVRSDPAVHYDVPQEELAEHVRKDRLTLSLLPEAGFPRLVECAVEMTDPGNPEFHYQLGVDMFTAGVEAASHRQDAAL